MASVGNPVKQLQVPHSRFSMLYLSALPNPSSLLLQKRPLRFQPLAFSPLEKSHSARGLSGESSHKVLKTLGFDSLVRHRRHGSSVIVSSAAAADADGGEIAAPEGSEFSLSLCVCFFGLNSIFFTLLFHQSIVLFVWNFELVVVGVFRIVKPPKSFAEKYPALITGSFFFLW